MENATFEEYKAKYPDLTTMGRNELLDALNEMNRIFSVAITNAQAVIDMEAKIKAVKAEADKIEHKLTLELMIAGVATIMICLGPVIESGGLTLLGFVLVAVAGGIYLKNHLSSSKTQKDLADEYRMQNLPPLEEQLKVLKDRRDKYYHSGEVQWMEQSLNAKYVKPDVIKMLAEYVDSGRADNLKEALNLYEEVAHRERMETMQSSILDAAQASAENSAVTAQASAVTAYSAVRSAKANEQAASDINRIRRALR